jgi:hypothetical protein
MAGFPGPDSKFSVAVVTDQKASDHSGNQSFYSPIDHGENVNIEDMMLSPMFNSPTGFMQQAFPGAMDPGTPVVVLKQLGELGGIILGQSNTVKQGGTNGSGGGNLGSTNKVAQLSQTTRNVNIAPDVQEVEENGAKIRKIVEKGQQHSLDLLDGLPIHGALFDIAGFRLPEIAQVPTATQTNDGMVSTEALQGMMGQIMSLGQMIQGLAGNGGAGGGGGGYGSGSLGAGYTPAGANTGAGGINYGGGLGNNNISAVNAPADTPLYTIMEGITPQMKAAVNSLSVLLQGYEVTGGVGFVTGDVVHEGTYLQNAEQLLSQVSSLEELMYVLNRLQWDTSLFGHDKIEPVINQIQTAWGIALQEIDVNGNIVITYGSQDAANLEMNFANTMTSNTTSAALGYLSNVDPIYSVNATQPLPTPSSAGNANGNGTSTQQALGQVQGIMSQIAGLAQGMNQNMFGESAETIKEMWKRMTREQENDAKQMHQKLNQANDTQKMTEIVKKTVEGGNPIDPQNLDPNALQSGGDISSDSSVTFAPSNISF